MSIQASYGFKWFVGVLLLFLLSIISSGCKKEFISDSESNSPIKYLIGGRQDKVMSIEKTSDGGFIYCGLTNSDLTNKDGFLMKVDANGNKQWYKTYGGANYDYFRNVIQTSDGGFMAIGSTNSYGKGIWDSTNNYFDYVVRTDANGEQLWVRSYNEASGIFTSNGYDILEGNFNHFYLTGSYQVNGITYTYLHYIRGDGNLAHTVLTNDTGRDLSSSAQSSAPALYYYPSIYYYPPNLVHSNYYHSWGCTLARGPLGEIIIGGQMSLSNIPGEAGQLITFLMNVDPATMYVTYFQPYYAYPRQQDYNFSDPTRRAPIKIKTLADGYLIATFMDYKGGFLKMQLIKTDFSGNIYWEKEYSGLGYSLLFNIEETDDGGFLLVGATSKDPINNSYPELFSNLKTALIKVDNQGNQIWTKYIGGESNVNIAKSAQKNSDGGWSIAAYSCSSETGFDKMYTMKVDKNGDIISK